MKLEIRNKCAYNASLGSYAVVSIKQNIATIYNWHSCREYFSHSFKKGKNNIAIYHGYGEGTNIIKCISQIEKRLKLKELSKFDYTKFILVIRLSPWWTENSLRRQFLTALLRVGRSHRSSINETLYKNTCNNYFKNTKPAVEKFLKGYTKYKGKPGGWYSTFRTNKNLSNLIKE